MRTLSALSTDGDVSDALLERALVIGLTEELRRDLASRETDKPEDPKRVDSDGAE